MPAFAGIPQAMIAGDYSTPFLALLFSGIQKTIELYVRVQSSLVFL